VAVEKQLSGALSQMELETDEILFLHLACRAIDSAMAENAFRVLWNRHRDYLQRSCRRLCQQLGAESAAADDLALATWARVNDHADQYRVGDARTYDAQVRRTRAWINAIAEHQLIDWLRNPISADQQDERLDRSVEDYSTQDFAQLCSEQFQAQGNSYRLSLIAQAFDEVLNEKERLVLKSTVVHRTYSPGGTYMQRGSTAALAATLNITAAGVRKCRHRAFQKIAAVLRERDGTMENST
jgi:RNA polymerase sigma factor (sigma-70 family)